MTAKATPPGMLNCMSMLMPVQDALNTLSGRWKIPIIIALSFGNRRFREITREVPGITDKVLSKELKELEANKLITRTVYDSFPPVVEYAITAHGRSVKDIVFELHRWGTKHRKAVMG